MKMNDSLYFWEYSYSLKLNFKFIRLDKITKSKNIKLKILIIIIVLVQGSIFLLFLDLFTKQIGQLSYKITKLYRKNYRNFFRFVTSNIFTK